MRLNRIVNSGLIAAAVFGSAIALPVASTAASSVSASSPAVLPAEDPLQAGFVTPPNAARPRVWWHWMSGNVSMAGAKLDLDWMQRVGVGGVHTFAGGGLMEPSVVTPPVDFMSPQWKDIFRTTTQKARELGMEVSIAGSPGWSETGGVWVTPAHAMKKYVWTETRIEGGKRFAGVLAAPPGVAGPFLGVKRKITARELTGDLYADSAVIAFPTPAAELRVGKPRWSSSAGAFDPAPLEDAQLSSSVALPVTNRSGWVQATYDRPTRLAALTLGLERVVDVDIEASDDGVKFRHIGGGAADQSETPAPEQTYAFAAVTARYFRVLLTIPADKPPLPDLPAMFVMMMKKPEPTSLGILQVKFSGDARVDHFESRAGFQPTIDERTGATPHAAPDATIPRASVVDLTSHLKSDGTLDWNVPAGSWTVLRMGWSLTGQSNGPAEPVDTGLEVDKLDPLLVREYIEHYLSLYKDAMGAELGQATVQNVLTDSWEAGVQNWTPTLPAQFKARRGYDMTPYLPVLAGRVVGDSASSDRFLWDFYSTLKEALADNHYGVLASVLHEHGMGYYTEAEGDTPRNIGDGMTLKARSDIPTAEYWYRPFATPAGQPSLKADLKEAASAAHVYGKPLVAAESLTVAAGSDPWAFSPEMLKPVADEIFASGVNRILMHESHLQPLDRVGPGLSMFIFGQFFNRNDTWAEQAGAWVDYLSRTSFMLQRGRYAADVAYFYGEDRNLTERQFTRFNTDVPAGYGYDYVNPEALLKLLSVKNGRLVTPSGMSYRVLYLPSYVSRVTLPVMRRLRDLVAAGAVVVGNAPAGGLGLESPDVAVAALAKEVWGTGASAAGGHAYGKGRVYATTDLAAALKSERLAADIAIDSGNAGDTYLTLHRTDGDAEIYFISNRQHAKRTVQVALRARGKRAELWRAEDGSVTPLNYQTGVQSAAPGTSLRLTLQPNDAVFLVLRGKGSGEQGIEEPAPATVLATLDGPWDVSFQPGRGAPVSAHFDTLTDWSISADTGIRYFSGIGAYKMTLDVPESWPHSRPLVLDLGVVHELAEVWLDGKHVAVSWHAPYTVTLPALAAGQHLLEIKVVNLWVNRLVGDKQPGAVAIAFAPQSPYEATSALRPSGLIGPVRLLSGN